MNSWKSRRGRSEGERSAIVTGLLVLEWGRSRARSSLERERTPFEDCQADGQMSIVVRCGFSPGTGWAGCSQEVKASPAVRLSQSPVRWMWLTES
jgi:hypothetical protein